MYYRPNVCPDEGLTLETSAKHHIPQAKNIPYQPLLIKPILTKFQPEGSVDSLGKRKQIVMSYIVKYAVGQFC